MAKVIPEQYFNFQILKFSTHIKRQPSLNLTLLLKLLIAESTIAYIWAPSREFVSSSISSWQILTAHAQPFRGARDLAFCLKVPLDSLLVWASSEGSGETAQMRRLAWTFAARICDKYQIRLTRSVWKFEVKYQIISKMTDFFISAIAGNYILILYLQCF